MKKTTPFCRKSKLWTIRYKAKKFRINALLTEIDINTFEYVKTIIKSFSKNLDLRSSCRNYFSLKKKIKIAISLRRFSEKCRW